MIRDFPYSTNLSHLADGDFDLDFPSIVLNDSGDEFIDL